MSRYIKTQQLITDKATYSWAELVGDSVAMAMADVSPVIGCWKLVLRLTWLESEKTHSARWPTFNTALFIYCNLAGHQSPLGIRTSCQYDNHLNPRNKHLIRFYWSTVLVATPTLELWTLASGQL